MTENSLEIQSSLKEMPSFFLEICAKSVQGLCSKTWILNYGKQRERGRAAESDGPSKAEKLEILRPAALKEPLWEGRLECLA